MNLKDISFKRLLSLIYIESRSTLKWLLMSFVILLSVIFLGSLFDVVRLLAVDVVMGIGSEIVGVYLFIGIFMSGTAYLDMYSKSKNHFFFMLPASIFEKFVSRLIFYIFIYSLIVICGLYVVVYIGSLFLGESDYALLFTRMKHLFIPEAISSFEEYIISASVILLGASFFKTKVVLKTIVSILLLVIGGTFVVLMGMRIWNPSVFTDDRILSWNIPEYIASLPYYVFVIFVIVLWVLSYFNIKRTQISSGV